MNKILEEKIISMEQQLWKAFANGDASSFKKLVTAEAAMICGGYRESGSEYANIVAQVKVDSYELNDIFLKEISDNTVLINYIIKIECLDPSMADMAGMFRVSSLWVKNDDEWKLVFNQDSKLI